MQINRLPLSQDFVNVVDKVGERGLLIMLDFHSATAGSWTTYETMADVFNGPRDADNKFSIYPCT